MKKTHISIAIFTVFILVLNACSNFLLEKPREFSDGENITAGIPEGLGSIGVVFSQGAARTVIPDPVVLATLSMKYWFTKDGGTAVEKLPEGGKFILEPGSYALRVDAFADGSTLVARGDTEFAVSAGLDGGTVNVTLRPIVSGEGTGSLDFGLQYPAEVTVETFTLTRIMGDEEPIDLMNPAPVTSGTNPVILSGTKNSIPVGYYLLRVVLRNSAGAAVGKSEVVHIYQNLSAVTQLAGYTFTVDDFSAYLVTNTNDSGVGSLRQAITDVPDGGIIQVALEPGSVIELASYLSITKNLIIEGNGVTLTRAASWTSVGATLLYSDTGGVVTIRRVNFKNGLAASYGGAIAKYSGALTLESCIFNGNRFTDPDAYGGGAVYCRDTDLIVRGCTFYRNTAGGHGGAVVLTNTGGTPTLTLTGNLFYGNTAGRNYPVVSVSGTASASYNVADVAFGTGSTQCGWAQGTGDAQIAALPVSGKTFKLLAGSGAAGKLPAVLPADYPATDFYGNTISGGGAAGAVQAGTTNQSGYYYIDLSVNNPSAGSVMPSLPPDEDGLYPAGSVTVTASPNDGYSFRYWLVNGSKPESPGVNTLTTSLSGHSVIQAVFSRAVTVGDFSDGAGSETNPGTLRYALTNAEDGDVITFSGVTAGTTTIALGSALPPISKSIIIEGNGVTLTRAASWTTVDYESQLLVINTVDVKIRRVHFKDGRAGGQGGAIWNRGTLTLESCIFSGNQTTGTAGSVYSDNGLTIRGCTFYGNTTSGQGGAVYFAGKTLTLTGNLFYGNTAERGKPVLCRTGTGTVTASYNVADAAIGTGLSQSGWTAGTGDAYAVAPSVSGKTFKLLAGSGAAGRLSSPLLPVAYPATDFYGAPISAGGAAGAVQATVENPSGVYLNLSANNPAAGSVAPSVPPDADDLYPAGSTVTASPNAGYSFGYWLVNGVKETAATLTPVTHSRIQAVFSRIVTVSSAADSGGGTLREALANAEDGDVITFSGVTAGITAIELESALPQITKSMTIEGNGVTLTRAASWTAVNETSQLLYINNTNAEVEVTIRRVYFKDGLSSSTGGAVSNTGTLTLESCIFSGSQAQGGAAVLHGYDNLTIRGCTFYANTATVLGGAVYFYGPGKTLTMTGNLFYGNTGGSGGYPVMGGILSGSDGTVAASYNVADVDFGTGDTQSGWEQGTGDTTFAALSITDAPFDTTTFVPVGGLGNVLPSLLPEDFPATDFYGNARTSRAPGAVDH